MPKPKPYDGAEPPQKRNLSRAAKPAHSPSKLEVRFGDAQPFLARFLPETAPQQWGLKAAFCDLYVYLAFLHMQEFAGYLHVQLEENVQAWALLHRGRVVAAAANVMRETGQPEGTRLRVSESLSGKEALGELAQMYQQGAELSAYRLEPELAQLLAGLGGGAQRYELGAEFSGVYASPASAEVYRGGKVVAVLNATLPYEAAFPAPEHPTALPFPKALAGWAHAEYALTLRGRDALSPITEAHMEFKDVLGGTEQALPLLIALSKGFSPAEYALDAEVPLGELEPVMNRFKELGYLGR